MIEAARVLFDRCCRRKPLPISYDALYQPEILSALTKLPITDIVNDRPKGSGDGATGTERYWVTARVLGSEDKEENKINHRDDDVDDDELVHFFVKVPASKIMFRLFLTFLGLYDNETYFFQHLASSIPKQLLPKVYFTQQQGTRFVIILEDLMKAGHQLPDLTQKLTPEHGYAVLDSLAKLHSVYWDAGYTVWQEWRRPPFFRTIAEGTLLAYNRKYSDLLPPELMSTYKKFIRNYNPVREYWNLGTRTLVHGDAHGGNIFYRSDGSAGFYDWQIVSVEQGMRDVTYFLMMSMDADVLEEHETKFIEYYLSQLQTYLKPRGQTHTITFNMAWNQYRAHSLYQLLAFVLTSGAADFVEAEKMIWICAERTKRACLRVKTGEMLDSILDGTASDNFYQ